MKKLLCAVIAALLCSCNGGGGGVGGPPPTPTPGPTSTPGGCGSASAPLHYRGRSIMYPRGKYPKPTAAAHLSYGGGPLLISPVIYSVFWGIGASDPVVVRYTETAQHLGGSGWLGTVTQYCNAQNVAIENPANILGGAWSDMTDPVPVSPTQAQIANEAEIAAKHFAIQSVEANATVVVLTPSGHSEAGFGTQFCGWHDATGANGLSYEYIPYMPDAGSSCGANSVQGPLDGVSIVGGHEIAESITDPQPASGWVDQANGEEIGDLCAWKDLKLVDLTGVNLPMQPLWSNAAGACEQ